VKLPVSISCIEVTVCYTRPLEMRIIAQRMTLRRDSISMLMSISSKFYRMGGPAGAECAFALPLPVGEGGSEGS